MIDELTDARSILLIKLRAVGDVVLSTVVLKNLREALPQAEIDFLTEPAGAGVLEGNPLLARTVVYDRRSMSGPGLIRLIRSRRYDAVIDLFCNPRTALVTRLSGARVRVGYRFRGRTYAYNTVVEPRGGEVHNTQFNLDALVRIGVPIVDRSLHIVPGEPDEEKAGRILWERRGRRIVAINPGGGWTVKRWPLDRFARLADMLIDELGVDILLLWGPGEGEEIEWLRRGMKHRPLIPPATKLLELAAILKRCWFMVSNDSGPMHIGAAMGIPVVGIFGPTNPHLQGPFGDQHQTVRNEELPCLGCNLTECPIGNPCMLELSVERVMEAARAMLHRNAMAR